MKIIIITDICAFLSLLITCLQVKQERYKHGKVHGLMMLVKLNVGVEQLIIQRRVSL